MEGSPFLPLPQGMLIAKVEQTTTSLTVTVASTRTEAICPGCGHTSEHIHSQYQKTVRDVPSGGRQVVLRLCVRKFFCLSLCCERMVFAERLPDLVQPPLDLLADRTTRSGFALARQPSRASGGQPRSRQWVC
jgi:hypothetical protein